jgi:hypothetical protein
VGEAIEGALGEDGIVEESDPLIDGAVAGDDGRGAPVAFEHDLVEVTRLLGAEAPATGALLAALAAAG